MPKRISKEEKKNILDIIERYPSGAFISSILQDLDAPISKRNLLHRLNLLVKEGQLLAEGKSRGRRYLLKDIKDVSFEENYEKNSIPLTTSGNEVRKLVQRPILKREHVSYNLKFLDRYRPNITRYLTESESKKLFQIGKTDGDRPAGTYARQVLNRLLIDLSWNSSRLEGNTYTLLETERLLDSSDYAEGKDLKDAQMILNHKAAIEFLVDSADEIGINKYTIRNLHALLSQNLLSDPEAGGRIRDCPQT